MQTYTVKNKVNIRTATDTGGGIIERQVPPGKRFDVLGFEYPAPGEIWAHIRKQDGTPWIFNEKPTDAYVCLVMGSNIFGLLSGQPDPAPSGGLTYVQGYADCKHDAMQAIQGLP